MFGLSHAHKLEASIILRFGRVRNYPLLKGVPQGYHRALLMRVAYSNTHNFFYPRIPKAANSTVVSTLIKHMHPEISGDRISLLKQSINRLPSLRRYNDAFKFTVVRDPTDRVISAFLDKGWKVGVTSSEEQADRKFLDFLNILAEGDFRGNGHFLPQTTMILGGIGAMDHVGRLETLNEDLKQICETIFGKYTSSRDVRSHRTDALEKRSQLLTAESVSRIVSLYARDYDELGYSHPQAMRD